MTWSNWLLSSLIVYVSHLGEMPRLTGLHGVLQWWKLTGWWWGLAPRTLRHFISIYMFFSLGGGRGVGSIHTKNLWNGFSSLSCIATQGSLWGKQLQAWPPGCLNLSEADSTGNRPMIDIDGDWGMVGLWITINHSPIPPTMAGYQLKKMGRMVEWFF